MHFPYSKPPPFAESNPNPAPEATATLRHPCVEEIVHPLPEVGLNHRSQAVEQMPNLLSELNTSQKHLEASMSIHYNDAILIATSTRTPFSPDQEAEARTPTASIEQLPPYDDNIPSSSSRTLQKPIVIPATTGKLGSPFLRCYAPILEQYHLPQDIFLTHLDALNKVTVASPPLQVIGFADEVSKVLPLPPIHLVGGIIGGIARLGSNGISYGRTELALKDLNRDVFGPRGLKIEIANMKALARITKMPILDANGNLRTDTKLLSVLQTDEVQTTSGHQRRCRALASWIEEFDLIPHSKVQEKTGLFRNMSVKMSEHDRRRHEKHLMRQRKQWHEQHTEELNQLEAEHDRRMDELDDKEARAAMRETHTLERKEKELDKLSKERERWERELNTRRKELERRWRENDQEEQEMRSSKWLVITNVE